MRVHLRAAVGCSGLLLAFLWVWNLKVPFKKSSSLENNYQSKGIAANDVKKPNRLFEEIAVSSLLQFQPRDHLTP